MEELTDTPSIINELGGVQAVANLTGRKYNAVWNWKDIGSFPPATYRALTEALNARGKTAPISLWRMKEPAQ